MALRLDRVWELVELDLNRVATSWQGREEDLDKLPAARRARFVEYIGLNSYILENSSEYKWFDLGTMSKDEMDEIEADFVKTEGIVDKSINLPFPKTIFSVKVTNISAAFVDVGDNDELRATHETDQMYFIMVCEDRGEDTILVAVMAYIPESNKANCPARPTVYTKVEREDGLSMWGASVVSSTKESTDAYDDIDFTYSKQMVPLFDYAMNLLSCNNVVVKKDEPPPRLNAKRAKDGKRYMIPDRYTIHIDVPECEVFRYGDGSSSHASPMIHMRRGHIRRLAEGKTTWVKPCVVGKKGKLEDKIYSVER